MYFFADKPELLGNTQTLVGVLLTFIVLCLFSNESNFLLKLICNMVADFTENLRTEICKINNEINEKKQEKEKNTDPIVANRSYWSEQSKKSPELEKRFLDNNKKELEIRDGILKNLEKYIDSFKDTDKILELKKESIFVSLYYLILLLTVMTMDACCVSAEFGSLFLFIGNLVSFYFTTMLWYRYIVDKKNEPLSYKEQHCGILKKVAIGTVASFLIWIVFIGAGIYEKWILWSVTILYAFLAISIFSYWLMHNFRYSVRYNNQFVIKHSLYMVIGSFLGAYILYRLRLLGMHNESSFAHIVILNLHTNINTIITDYYIVRIIFILLAAGNTFFVPLLLGYYYNWRKAVSVKNDMASKKSTIIEELMNNHDEYRIIISEIQDIAANK